MSPKIIVYFVLSYVLSILIAVISGMTLHIAANQDSVSTDYKNNMKIIGTVCLVGSASVLLAVPTISFPSDLSRKLLVMYLAAIVLSALIGALAGMSIDATNKSNEPDVYKKTVYGLASTSIAVALCVVVGGPILLLMGDKKTLAMVLVAMVLAALIAAIAGMGIHASTVELGSDYKTALQIVAGVSLAGAGLGLISIPLLAYKMK